MKRLARVVTVTGCLGILLLCQTGAWAAPKAKKSSVGISDFRIAYLETVAKKNSMGEEIEAEVPAASKLTMGEIQKVFSRYAKGGKAAFSVSSIVNLTASMDVVFDYSKFSNAKDIAKLFNPGAKLKLALSCNAKQKLCEPIAFFGSVLHSELIPGEDESMQEHEVMVQVNSNMLHDVMQTGKIEYFFRFAPAPSPTFGWSSTMPDETAAMLKEHFPNTQIVRVTPPSN